MKTLTAPLPPFFSDSSAKADQVFRVPYQERATQAQAWAKQHGIKHAALDKYRIALLPIDFQNTFCTPGFELVVEGAVDDVRRSAEWVYRNMPVITSISPTMDTHLSQQIFHPTFLVDENGANPSPGTIITHDMVASGKIRVNPAVVNSLAGGNYVLLQAHLEHYTRTLEEGVPVDPQNPSGPKRPKYPLMVWPYHAMLGGIGHALVSMFEEAVFFHAIARGSQTGFEIKGGNPLTENYSIFRPEVLTGSNGKPIAQKNTRFIDSLLKNDVVIIIGEAKSHCVAWAIDDLLGEINAVDPALAQKVYLVEDLTSPVIIPGVIDFTQQANDAFDRFAAAGMHVVKSTTPLADWPGIRL